LTSPFFFKKKEEQKSIGLTDCQVMVVWFEWTREKSESRTRPNEAQGQQLQSQKVKSRHEAGGSPE
jgi:hypothetical protein